MPVKAALHFAIALLILLASPPILSAAQDEASAKAFLQSVYRHYQNGGQGIDLSGPKSHLYLHSSLVALIRADLKASGPDSVPEMDFDPVCGCQDWDGIWDLKIEVQLQDSSRAVADVSFALSAPKGRATDSLRKLQITLVPERGQWRIYDTLDESDPKAVVALRKILGEDTAPASKPTLPR